MRAGIILLFLATFSLSVFTKYSPATSAFLKQEMESSNSDYSMNRGI